MLMVPLITKCNKFSKIGNIIINSTCRLSSTLSYCIELVKRHDYENYLCTLLLPHNLKACAIAIRAFNIELSKIQEQVTESNIMPIRFKFWDDQLNDVYNNKSINHPVVTELRNAVNRHKLSKMFFRRLLSSRLKLSNRSTFHDMKEMISYADQTNSPIYMLLLEANGVKNVDADHAASHLGTAQGIANLIRGLPFNIRERLILMPMSILSRYDVSEESLLRMTVGPQLNDIVFEVATEAKKHLDIAESLIEKIPKEQRSIFLPLVAVSEFLVTLERNSFDAFASHTRVTAVDNAKELYRKRIQKTENVEIKNILYQYQYL